MGHKRVVPEEETVQRSRHAVRAEATARSRKRQSHALELVQLSPLKSPDLQLIPLTNIAEGTWEYEHARIFNDLLPCVRSPHTQLDNSRIIAKAARGCKWHMVQELSAIRWKSPNLYWLPLAHPKQLQAVSDWLDDPQSVPLVYEMAPCTILWEDVCRLLREYPAGATCSILDPSRSVDEDLTISTDVRTLSRMLEDPTCKQVNVLDIASPLAVDWIPHEIAAVSLEHKLCNYLSRKDRSELGKEGAAHSKRIAEWMLISKAEGSQMGLLSPAHRDNAGKWTYLRIGHGKKIFFFPSGERSDPEGEWIAVEITRDKGLAFTPGEKHMVITLTNTIAVGVHFWTASAFALSITMIHRQLQHPEEGNEDIGPGEWSMLSLILSHDVEAEMFTDEQRREIYPPLRRLVDDEQLFRPGGGAKKSRPKIKQSPMMDFRSAAMDWLQDNADRDPVFSRHWTPLQKFS